MRRSGGEVNCQNVTKVSHSLLNNSGYAITIETPEPLFSVEAYFLLLSLFMGFCFLAYVILNYTKWARNEYAVAKKDSIGESTKIVERKSDQDAAESSPSSQGFEKNMLILNVFIISFLY